MSKPSVILLGSKPGSVVALSVMIERGWEIRAVVTSRRNVHPWIAGPTLEACATAHGIPVLSQIHLPGHYLADFVVSYMFRARVMGDVLSLAARAAVNFHAGPLPEFGGWAFYSVAILEDVSEYGCTCHYMDNGFDTGPLLKVRRFPINASQETAYSLEQKTQAEMVRLFIDFCDLAESGHPLPCEPQHKPSMRYLTLQEFDALKRIPAAADRDTVEKYARAFWYPPYTCAQIAIDDHVVEIFPSIAGGELAALLHDRDLSNLQEVAAAYRVRVAQ